MTMTRTVDVFEKKWRRHDDFALAINEAPPWLWVKPKWTQPLFFALINFYQPDSNNFFLIIFS